jgi:DNA-binding GntR family transcriptional regulator
LPHTHHDIRGNKTLDLKKEHKSLEQRAYEVIKDMIIFGTLKPNERLKEVKIADQLGVSRTTVTKAFIRLKGEYLLEDSPTQGVQVRLSTPEEALEAYEIREVLEGLASRIAVRVLSDETIDELIARFVAYSQNPASDYSDDYVRLNFEMHQMISQCLVNRAARMLIVNMTMQTRLFGNKNPYYTNVGESIQKHLDILYALKKRDEDAAENAMRSHIRDIRAAFRAMIDDDSMMLNAQ